jgi:hypothetical protein
MPKDPFKKTQPIYMSPLQTPSESAISQTVRYDPQSFDAQITRVLARIDQIEEGRREHREYVKRKLDEIWEEQHVARTTLEEHDKAILKIKGVGGSYYRKIATVGATITFLSVLLWTVWGREIKQYILPGAHEIEVICNTAVAQHTKEFVHKPVSSTSVRQTVDVD